MQRLLPLFLFILFITNSIYAQQKIGLLTQNPDAPVHIWSPGQVNTPGGLLLLGHRNEANMTLDFNYLQSRFGALSTLPLLINPDGGDLGINTWAPQAPFHLSSSGQVSNSTGHLLIGNRSEGHLEMDFDFIQSRYSATSFLNFRMQPNGGNFTVGNNHLFVSDQDNVGIGTNDPLADLHVASDSPTTQILITPSGASQQNSEIIFSEGSSNLFTMSLLLSGTENALQVFGKSVNNVYGPHLHIERISGNTGIKTNNPVADLHVASHSDLTTLLISPEGNANGDSDLMLAEGEDGKLGMRLHYDGGTNRLEFFGHLPGDVIEGPHFSVTRNSGVVRIPGLVSIGDYGNIPAGYQFVVDGKIRSEGIKCDLSGNWADYVFDENYDLPDIEEVAEFIEKENHLPGFESAKKLKEIGIDFEEITTQQQQKIEELMLYIIGLNSEIKSIKEELELLKNSYENE